MHWELINTILRPSNKIIAQLEGGGERLVPSTGGLEQTTHPLNQPTRSTLDKASSTICH